VEGGVVGDGDIVAREGMAVMGERGWVDAAGTA
jgi:hypothetical protein